MQDGAPARSPSHAVSGSAGWNDSDARGAAVTARPAMPNPEVSIRHILVACVNYDPARVRDELDLAIGASSLGGCVDDVLFPALREIGSLWQSGELDLEAERLTSEAVRGWLEALALRAPEPTDAAPLLLACGPADQHSIGLEALDVLLRHQGQALPRPRQQDVGPRAHHSGEREPAQSRRDRVPPQGQPFERHELDSCCCRARRRGLLRRRRLFLREAAPARPRDSSGLDPAERVRPAPRRRPSPQVSD